MDYRSKTSSKNLEELFKLLQERSLPKFQGGGVNDGVDPYAAYLMRQDPKTLSRQDKKYLKDLGLTPGFDTYGGAPDTQVYGDIFGNIDLSGSIFSDNPSNPYGAGDQMMVNPNMGGQGTPFGPQQPVFDPNAQDPYAAYLMSQDPNSLSRKDKKYLEYSNTMGNMGSTGYIAPITGAGTPAGGGSPITSGGGYNPMNDRMLSDADYEAMMKSGNIPEHAPGTLFSTSIYKTPEDVARAYDEGKVSKEQFDKIAGSMQAGTYGTGPTDLRTEEEIEAAWNRGEISKEQYDDIYTQLSNKGEGTVHPDAGKEEDNQWARAMGMLPYLSPSLSMEGVLHHMGRAIGAPKGTKGRGLQIGLTAADALLKGTRNVLSGVGLSKVNKETRDWYMEQMAKRQRGYYEADPQYDDVNYTGGFSFAKYGGMKKYPDGGEHGEPEQDNVIHSRFDPRFTEYQDLVTRAKALEEYKKWHQTVAKTNPQTGAEFKALEAKSDSLAFARQFLPMAEGDKPTLWTNPTTNTVVRKELDMSPVNNPYTVDIPATPWSGTENAQEQGDKFRSWVNKEHPELAKQWDIDAKGNPDNKFIRSAYYELKDEYETSQKPAPKKSVKERVEEKPEDKFAYRTQTIISPDGTKKIVSVPYYNYATRENIEAPRVVRVDEQGNTIEELQKYGGLFGGNKMPKYFAGGFADLGDKAFEVFNSALQAQNTINANKTTAGNDAGMTDVSNPNASTPNPLSGPVDTTSTTTMDGGYQVGQPVTFKYGGRMVSGIIKKIENGKIYI
jgi:hypothetical protein